ncbi:MAG: PIG-L family deacetylase [Pyrinomonadaceae bacterium MAG19_C2-C3]|nr:PIG-L family deacetylase [Pyrinomonadaceae bacterium MAG19_C2-C3]
MIKTKLLTFFLALILMTLNALPSLAQTASGTTSNTTFNAASNARPPRVLNAAELRLALEKINVVGGVLFIAAHPDDENTALLAYLANERRLRTAYLSLTRGDGGQNLIGNERGAQLGLIRTQELLAARRIDGAEQFFTRAQDFGFSKNPEETLRTWNRDEVLGDIVWVIRRFRPDVIITRFPTTGEGGHGHHTASAILAGEAFKLAADPRAYPEQLKFVSVWQAKRLLWNAFANAKGQGIAPDLTLDVGTYNTLLGRSYNEIAATSRSQHRSQGFGSAERRGTTPNTFRQLAGTPARQDVFDDIDLSWSRIEAGKMIGDKLAAARDAFNPTAPHLILPRLTAAYLELERLRPTQIIEAKKRDLLHIIQSCAGLSMEAVSTTNAASPDGQATVNLTLNNRSPAMLSLSRVRVAQVGFDETIETNLPLNQNVTRELKLSIPANAALTNPYWLTSHALTVNEIGTPQTSLTPESIPLALIGRAESPPALTARVDIKIAGQTLTYDLPILSRSVDPVRGELFRPFAIVPRASLSFDEAVYVLPNGETKRVKVRVRSNATGNTSGDVRLRLPVGWSAMPSSIPLTLKAIDEEREVEFEVKFNSNAPTSTQTQSTDSQSVEAIAEFVSKDSRLITNLITIDYPHIPAQTLQPVAAVKLVHLSLSRRGSNIGYIMGSGDDIPQALAQVGYTVTSLSDRELSEADFAKYDAIVTGIRAYNTRPALSRHQPRLLSYVERGGTLVVQYNTADADLPANLGVYPFKISRERVTLEEAPVNLINPNDALLTTPNRITARDFDGWVQERGLYFASEWDARYTTPLESHDPNESAKPGGMLVARHGRGTYIYTSYAWFRQLPAGVPGAYRLFVNMVSAGKK